jgi:hypothetical protein
VEEVKKLLPSVQLAMSLTDMEILRIRSAKLVGSWQEVIEKANRAMAMDFLLHLCKTYRIESWSTSWQYFRQYKQSYASVTGRYMDRNESITRKSVSWLSVWWLDGRPGMRIPR